MTWGCAFAQSSKVVLVGATIHVGNGTVVENGAVYFQNGKITSVLSSLKDTAGFTVINVKGKHVYPGLILMNSSLGLTEIEAVRATQDSHEVGEFNSNVKAITAYNVDSDVMPTIRSNGVVFAQTTPRGGIISGSSSLVVLSGWNVEEVGYRVDEGMHLLWPSYYTSSHSEVDKHVQHRTETIQKINDFFTDAKNYKSIKNVIKSNQRLDAMKGLFDSTQTLYVHLDAAKEIIEAINFAATYGVKRLTLVGANNCASVLDIIKENNVSMVLDRIHQLPTMAETDVNAPYKLPSLLTKAGITWAFGYYGDMEIMGSRNLPFLAGTATAWGINKEEALTALTLSPAKITGASNTIGSLEAGKDASLIVSDGDLFDMRTSNVVRMYIKGKEINLSDKHKQLYLKYSEKYSK